MQLEERLMALPGVANVAPQGLSQRQWQVEVPRAVLAQHGLSAHDVAMRLQQQRVDVPLGILETRERHILLRFTGQRRSLEAIANVGVGSGSSRSARSFGDTARMH